MKSRARWLGLLTLVTLVGATLASTTAAFGDHQDGSATAQEGILQLHLDPIGADFFSYTPNGGAATLQSIPQPGNCEFRGGNSVNGPLVVLTSSAGNPGFFDNGIGNRIRGARGSKCGLVDGFDEDLVLKLAGPDLDDRWIKSAELDIEFKFDAVVAIELWHTSAVSNNGQDLLIDTIRVECAELSDCGPDSADGDNFRVLVEASSTAAEDGLFDKMVFRLHPDSPANGAFALEGGADGTPALPGGIGASLGTTDSVFDIWRTYDGILACGDTVRESNTTSGLVGTFTVIRDDGGSTDCPATKPYELEVGADQIDFEPIGVAGWFYSGLLEKDDISTIGIPVLETLEYDDGSGFRDMLYCDWATFGTTTFGSETIDVVTDAGIPSGHTFCIARITGETVDDAVGGTPQFRWEWLIGGNADPSYGWK